MNKDFNISDLSQEVQDLYVNAQSDYKDIIANIFNPSVQEVEDKDRPAPKYAHGTLTKHIFQGGMPVEEKAQRLIRAILSGNYRFVEIEGGVRGGKDIYALFAWSKYLMSCPDRVHLALGSSLEHVLRTVLMSNGFGLYFLIPHGIFVRETINGAQRGIYKFLDNYGLEKQILFYGNEKENDKNKFQGFTIGSVYVNETLNQHVEGLIEANNRMASVRQPLMIMTQNPRGKAHPYYMRFEKQRLTTLKEITKMEYIRDTYKESFEAFEKQIIKDRDLEKKKVINQVLKNYAKSKIKELPVKQQIRLNEMLLDINFEFDKLIRDKSVQDFAPNEVKEGDYLFGKSMKKVVAFDRGTENPNKVLNAYDFYYEHFTVDDNLSMSEMQRNDFKNTYAVGTSSYDQSVLGLRRSTDSAVFSMFMNVLYPKGNVVDDEFERNFDYSRTMRIMAVDKGLNHPNGIVDLEVDFERGTMVQFNESLLDVKSADVENLGMETVYQEVLKVIRFRRNRSMPIAIIVDPSAIELYIYLREKGLPVIKGNNAVFKQRGEDSTLSNKTQDKDMIGIPLMQTAIAKFKFLIHERCVYTIEQIGSYEAPFDETTGKEKVRKVNDDLVDPLRYAFNQYIRTNMWEGEKKSDVEKENERISISEDVGTQGEEKSITERVIEAFRGDFPQLDDTGDGDGTFDFFEGQGKGFWN